MREQALYHVLDNDDYIGNPLIEALPPMEEPSNYAEHLMVLPSYTDDERKKSPAWRLSRLPRISQIHIPTKEDSMLMLNISRCIRWSYVGRNPMPFETVEKCLCDSGIEVNDQVKRYILANKAPIYGFPVLGISGVGKTTSVENVLTLFPQVISHTNYRGNTFKEEQLVWLKVDCPPDGSQKGLCSAILKGIDSALGANYTEQIFRNRMSKDLLLTNVSKLIESLHLGLLLIDDIQNLCGAKETVSDELLSFMVSLSNSLRIPVAMIGTPKILLLLQREYQQAKRASGEGEIKLELMQRNSKEWKRFIQTIWRYQYTSEKVNLTARMEEAFFEESVGNPFVASTLYKIVQDDAIISRKEKFTPADVRRVAREKMGFTSKKRRDMLEGRDVELNAYNHLWDSFSFSLGYTAPDKKNKTKAASHEEEYSRLTMDVSEKLEKMGFTVKDARSYARQAIAAYPNESSIDILYGYALLLYSAKKKSNDTELPQAE